MAQTIIVLLKYIFQIQYSYTSYLMSLIITLVYENVSLGTVFEVVVLTHLDNANVVHSCVLSAEGSAAPGKLNDCKCVQKVTPMGHSM